MIINSPSVPAKCYCPTLEVFLKPAIPLYLLLTFSRFFFENEYLSSAIAVITVFYGLLLLLFFIGEFSKYRLSTFFVILCSISFFGTALIGGNHHAYSAVIFLSNIGYASVFIVRPISPKIIELMYILVCLFFLWCAWNGVNPENVFFVSRNFISVFMLLVVSLYYISCWQHGENPKLYVSILALVVALWAIGRAGIAVFLGLFLFTYIFLPRKKMKARIIGIFFVLVAFTLFSFSFEGIANFEIFLVGIERFNRLGLESARESINSSYIGAAFDSARGFLFGARLKGIEEIVEVGGNPHNSFINLHVNSGFFGALLLTVAIFHSLKKIVLTSNLILFIVLVSCLLRSFFDISAFYGPLDVAIMFPVLYYLSKIRVVMSSLDYS